MTGWPAVSYDRWQPTCDTLHMHTQLLGKLAVRLAPAEPQLQHGALRLTARGFETQPLPAPDGSGSIVVALDLRSHEAVVEHSDGPTERVPLTRDRSVADVTADVLAAVSALAGPVRINPRPQEVAWTIPLDEDELHATYDPAQVRDYFGAATQAAVVLAAFRAPYRGRSTPVNAWWGTFDLAVSLFSGSGVDPGTDDFIRRNSADVQAVEVGWWPGDERHPSAAFYAFAYPAEADFGRASLTPPEAYWDAQLGEYILEWDDVRSSPDPRATALAFLRNVFQHACEACRWPLDLARSAAGIPPPLR